MRKTLFAIVMAVVATAQTTAQTKEGNFSYYLPRTEVRLALLIEKTSYTPGRLAGYADLLFKQEANSKPSTSYRIVGATLSTTGQPDKEKKYDLIIDRKHSIFNLDCDRNGVLKAINAKGKEAQTVALFKSAPKPIALNPNDYMSQDILASGNEPKTARLVAQEIYDIRDSRNQLARGEAEFMPKDGEQLKIMLSQLDTQEKALLQLFEGTTTVDTTETLITFIPTKAENKTLIFRFSKHYGLTAVDDLSGAPYYAVITDEGILAEAPAVDAEAKKHKDDLEIGVNIPGKIKIDITNGTQSVLTTDIYAAQYGRVEMLPGALFGKKLTSQIVLDATTGAVTSLKTEPLE